MPGLDDLLPEAAQAAGFDQEPVDRARFDHDVSGAYKRFEEKFSNQKVNPLNFITRPTVKRIFDTSVDYKNLQPDELEDGWRFYKSMQQSGAGLPVNADVQKAVGGMDLMMQYGLKAPAPPTIDEERRQELLDAGSEEIPDRELIGASDINRGEGATAIGLLFGRLLRGESLATASTAVGQVLTGTQSRKDNEREVEIQNIGIRQTRAMKELALMQTDFQADQQRYLAAEAQYNQNLREAASLGQNQFQFEERMVLANQELTAQLEQGEAALLSEMSKILLPAEREEFFKSVEDKFTSPTGIALAKQFVKRGAALTPDDELKQIQLDTARRAYKGVGLDNVNKKWRNQILKAEVDRGYLNDFNATIEALSNYFQFQMQQKYGERQIQAQLNHTSAQIASLNSSVATQRMQRWLGAFEFAGNLAERQAAQYKAQTQFENRGEILGLMDAYKVSTQFLGVEDKRIIAVQTDMRNLQEKLLVAQNAGRDSFKVGKVEYTIESAMDKIAGYNSIIQQSEQVRAGQFGSAIGPDDPDGSGILGLIDQLSILGVQFDAKGAPILPEVLQQGFMAAPAGMGDFEAAAAGILNDLMADGPGKEISTVVGSLGSLAPKEQVGDRRGSNPNRPG